MADRKAGIPAGNTTAFPIIDKTLYANTAIKTILSWIYFAYGGWRYQDSNDTSDPWADVASVANINKIAIPTAALDLVGVAWLDTTVNEYRPLKPITLEEIQAQGKTLQNYQNVPGLPQEYLPIGNTIYIFPALATSTAAAYRAYFSRGSSIFTTTDTTKTPGFISEFHEAVPTYMALKYAEVNQLANATELRKEWSNEADGNYPDGYEQRIKKFFGMRFAQDFPKPITHHRDIVRDYM